MIHTTWTPAQVMNSSVWIAVLIVHVSCIIEVYPSKSSQRLVPSGSISDYSSNHKRIQYSPVSSSLPSFTLLRTPSASEEPSKTRDELTNLVLGDRPYRGRKLSTTSLPQKLTSNKPHENLSDDLTISQSSAPSNPTTSKITTTTSASPSSPTTTAPSTSTDSCAGKADGYYQNLGSSCTSYYFCAAGYQMTYICPPGEAFDGKKCSDEYECPEKGNLFSNPCARKKNGYYGNPVSPSTYHYCFHQAKVIQLQCDSGKVFIGDKCVLRSKEQKQNDGRDSLTNKDYHPTKEEVTYEIHTHESPSTSSACADLGNGFFPLQKSACKKYFYCINGEKTLLNCQPDFLFNGDICVHNSRYECPYSETQAEENIHSTTHSSSHPEIKKD